MGDVIHTLPAITDAKKHCPELMIDWIVEEDFQEIAKWHPAVNQVIPVALRRWRKNWFKSLRSDEFKQFKKRINEIPYDFILDAQGLLKSAALLFLLKGKKVGMDFRSAREPAATLFYQKKLAVEKDQHAIDRVRDLFAKAFGYAITNPVPQYGLKAFDIDLPMDLHEPYVVFLHGTTWATKHWPEIYWQQLAEMFKQTEYKIYLPFGNDIEKARAEKIAAHNPKAEVLPKLNLNQLAATLSKAKGIIAVDTGLGHLSAAVDTPTVSIYGATDPQKIGTRGAAQIHLMGDFPCSPCLKRECTYPEKLAVSPACYTKIPPSQVYAEFIKLIQTTTIVVPIS